MISIYQYNKTYTSRFALIVPLGSRVLRTRRYKSGTGIEEDTYSSVEAWKSGSDPLISFKLELHL